MSEGEYASIAVLSHMQECQYCPSATGILRIQRAMANYKALIHHIAGGPRPRAEVGGLSQSGPGYSNKIKKGVCYDFQHTGEKIEKSRV